MAVAPHHRRRHGQRVENGFFRGLDRRRNQWVQMRVGKVHLLKGRIFRIMRNDVPGREGQHEIAASVARSGACSRQSQHSTFRQPRKLPTVERSIGGDDNDDRAFALSR